MEIKSTLTNRSGQTLDVTYWDVLGEPDFKDKNISGVHAFCFSGDRMVIVFAESKGYWTPPGGGVEPRESVRDAVRREIQEETNMRVLKLRFAGFQDIAGPQGIVSQARAVCLVEPYGDFVTDPDGEITEVKLIDPRDCKKYFDWGVIGDRLLERALELKREMETEVQYPS